MTQRQTARLLRKGTIATKGKNEARFEYLTPKQQRTALLRKAKQQKGRR